MRAPAFGKKLLLVGCLVMGASVAGIAQAACRTSDLAGTWHAMGISGNVVGSYFDISNRCKIKINSSGSIIASASSCTYYDWTGSGTSNITGGQLTVNSSCAVSGTIGICEPNGCIDVRVQFAQIQRDKTAFPLQGFSTSDRGFRYVLHFVKQ